MSAFSAISLGSPIALGIIPFAAILIYAYRKKKKAIKVPTTFILAKLKKQQITRKQIKLPIRFFLELLALLLLALSLSKPIIKNDNQIKAIIFDNSLSTSAKRNDKKSRFEFQKTQTKELLDSQKADTNYYFFQTANNCKKLTENAINKGKTESLLSELSQSVSEDNIASCVKKTIENGLFDEIFVITDKFPNYEESDQDLPEENLRPLTFLNSYEESSNIFIKKAELDPKKNLIKIQIVSSGEKANKANLTIIQNQDTSFLKKSDNSIFIKNSEEEVSIPIELDSKTTNLEITISSGKDSISLDDKFYLTNKDLNKKKIFLFSEEGKTFNLERISSHKLVLARKEELLEKKLNISKSDVLIFHKTSSDLPLEFPTIYILPETDSPFFQIKNVEQNPTVSSWKEAHQINNYIKHSLLKLNSAIIFETPAWVEQVINIEKGATLVAGEKDNIRFAAFGFEILPFEAAKTPLSSILLLNTINWLNSADETLFALNKKAKLKENQSWEILDPSKNLKKVEASSSEDFFLIDQLGIYNFKAQDLKTRQITEFEVAINLLDNNESLSAQKFFFNTKSKFYSNKANNSKSDLTQYLLFIILLILLVESTIYIGRDREKGGEDNV